MFIPKSRLFIVYQEKSTTIRGRGSSVRVPCLVNESSPFHSPGVGISDLVGFPTRNVPQLICCTYIGQNQSQGGIHHIPLFYKCSRQVTHFWGSVGHCDVQLVRVVSYSTISIRILGTSRASHALG